LNLKIFLLVFFFLNCSTIEKKTNYRDFVLYDNLLLDQLLAMESETIYSTHHFYRNIKSVHIKRINYEGVIESSLKYFYDENHKLYRLINFDENNNITGDRTYYNHLKYGGEQILKNCFFLKNSDTIWTSSQIDTLNKYIVTKTKSKNELQSIDSIYYESFFDPILIKKFDSNMSLTHQYEFTYEYDKIKSSSIFFANGNCWGSINYYDSLGRFICLYNLDNDNGLYKSNEMDKNSVYTVHWSPNGFVFYDNISNEKDSFNIMTSVITRTLEDGTKYTTFLNEDLLPIEVNRYSNIENETSSVYYKYNEYGDIISKKHSNLDSSYDNETLEYEYDGKRNWVKRRLFKNKEYFQTTERSIEYY